jgi:outer membrane protease
MIRSAPAIFLITALVVLAHSVPVRPDGPAKDEAAPNKVETANNRRKPLIPLTEYLSLGLKTETFFSSHTSYQFGNPLPPFQSPLSRLEFPMDSTWVGGKLRASFPRFSIGAEGLTNISMDTPGHMQDSDWDDIQRPSALSIYSESKCRFMPSYIVRTDIDLKISDWVGLPPGLDLRPLVGFRWENFHFITHDGLQTYPLGGQPPDPLPGDGIDFKQTYFQYFTGVRTAVDLWKPRILNSLSLFLQADWAYVDGSNVDHHLLRGPRYTYEDTRGDAWHWTAGLSAGLAKNVLLTLEADFLTLSTTGSHLLQTPGFNIGFDYGVRVWSQQNSISLILAYAF